ncbi:MAG: GAF domain-containing protein [Candidatus Pacebacteria bacterium]|nr:GAF domain-containing protein [Candidatus Paceibacterota bacterium]
MISFAVLMGIFSTLVQLISFSKYIYEVVENRLETSVITWIGMMVAFGVILTTGIWSTGKFFTPVFFPPMLTIVMSGLIVVLVLRNRHLAKREGLAKTHNPPSSEANHFYGFSTERLNLFFTVFLLTVPQIGLALTLILQDPFWGVALGCFTIFVAAFPIVINVRSNPMSEDLNSWGLSLLSSVLGVFAIERFEFAEIYFAVFSLLNAGLPWFVVFKVQSQHPKLLESILLELKKIGRADGATLYEIDPDEPNQLNYVMVHNDSLKISMGGTTGKAINFPPLKLHVEFGAPNLSTIATSVCFTMNSLLIEDIYQDTKGFNLKGTFSFDKSFNYTTRSILAVPLISKLGQVVGVIQLINPRDRQTGKLISFDDQAIKKIEAMAKQAGEVLETQLVLRHINNPLSAIVVNVLTRLVIDLLTVIQLMTGHNSQVKANGLITRTRGEVG